MKIAITFLIVIVSVLSCGEHSSIDTFSKYEWYKLDISAKDKLGGLTFRGDSIYRLVLGTDSLNPSPIYASDSALKMYYPQLNNEKAIFHPYSVISQNENTFLFVDFVETGRIEDCDIFKMKSSTNQPVDNHNILVDLQQVKKFMKTRADLFE